MANGKTKTYTAEGARYGFDAIAFNRAFKLKAKCEGETLENFGESIAEAVCVSPKALKAWRYGTNAPVDIETVHKLESLLGTNSLLAERKDDGMEKLTPTQCESVARVYAAISDFLYMLDMTDGCVWGDYSLPQGGPCDKYLMPRPLDGEDTEHIKDGEDLAAAGYSWTCHALEREWVFIGSHQIYEELVEFMDDPLYNVWHGKTDPDYRFHYAGKFENPKDAPYEGYNEEYAGWMDTAEVDKMIREIIAAYM